VFLLAFGRGIFTRLEGGNMRSLRWLVSNRSKMKHIGGSGRRMRGLTQRVVVKVG
jgi:hypothetical protein